MAGLIVRAAVVDGVHHLIPQAGLGDGGGRGLGGPEQAVEGDIRARLLDEQRVEGPAVLRESRVVLLGGKQRTEAGGGIHQVFSALPAQQISGAVAHGGGEGVLARRAAQQNVHIAQHPRLKQGVGIGLCVQPVPEVDQRHMKAQTRLRLHLLRIAGKVRNGLGAEHIGIVRRRAAPGGQAGRSQRRPRQRHHKAQAKAKQAFQTHRLRPLTRTARRARRPAGGPAPRSGARQAGR